MYATSSERQGGGSGLKRETIVSVVIPIRNEEAYIESCLQSVLQQDYPKGKLEINLIDGMSEDRTAELLRPYLEQYPLIHLYQNPNRTVPYAMNIGIQNAQGEYIIRLDAHAEYGTDYISKCVEYLEKTHAANVGGPALAVGKTTVQKAIAAAYHSVFAMGGGKYHQPGYTGYADTVWPGAFRKSTLLAVGMYDERLTVNEDDELNLRILARREKVFITPEIVCRYYPRSSLKALVRQYFRFGLWKPAVMKLHKRPARLTHLVPAGFVLFLIFFGLGALFSKAAAILFFSVMALYTFLNLYFSFGSPHAKGLAVKTCLVLVHFLLHVSYGLGFLTGIYRFLLRKSVLDDG